MGNIAAVDTLRFAAANLVNTATILGRGGHMGKGTPALQGRTLFLFYKAFICQFFFR